MSQSSAQPGVRASDTSIPVVRIGVDRRLAAAERIVGHAPGSKTVAARRFLEAADRLGMDVSLMWGVPEANGKRFRQVCLAVVGSGRTAMLFVSGPEEGAGGPEEPVRAAAERRAVVDAACAFLADLKAPGGQGQRVVLAQALLEQDEPEAMVALEQAGFQRLGDLAYLRRATPTSGGAPGTVNPAWPAGVTVKRLSELPEEEGTKLLMVALERTYEETLDCPELCGLRDVVDVLESHRSVGVCDLSMWWVVLDGGAPEGCMLLSGCPEQQAIELVYVGLSPRLRGKRLGSMLLGMGLASVAGRSEKTVTCAVDTRNEPAMRLYRRMGFQQCASRAPFVKSLRGGVGGVKH